LTIIYYILKNNEPFRELKEKLYESKIKCWKEALKINENDLNKIMAKFIQKEILDKLFLKEKLIC